MPVSFQFACDPPLARLRLCGEVDDAASDRLAEVLARLQLRGCRRVELDALAVTAIGTRPLQLIASEQRRLRAVHGDLSVVAASPYYSLVTELAGYDSLKARPGAPRLTLLRTVPHLHLVPPPQERPAQHMDAGQDAG